MKRVLVLGCPGAGKSTFARKLSAATGLPLIYMDMIWHRPDRTVIGREALIRELDRVMAGESWIIDGNYISTLPQRLSRCDTVFFFDLPAEICLAGAIARLGRQREDMPRMDNELDEEFRQWILDFDKDQRPEIMRLLGACGHDVTVFSSRAEADEYIDRIKK